MGSTFADSDYEDTVESQLTLGTASLLGIFFGLVMVCGIFFGFGYSMGRRNASTLSAASTLPAHVPAPAPMMAQAQPATSPAASLTPDTGTTGSMVELAAIPPAAPMPLPAHALVAATPKLLATLKVPESVSAPINMSGVSQPKQTPIASRSLVTGTSTHTDLHVIQGQLSPIEPVTTADHAYIEPKERTAKPSAIQSTPDQPATRIPQQRVAAGLQTAATPYLVWTPPFDVHYKKGFKHGITETASRGALTGASHPAGTYAIVRNTMPHLSPSSSAMTVQVAALSRQDDAEVLVSALKQHGYAPSIQSGSEDTLFHVQVGPFSRDVAFATRQRLIARGYNATLK